MSQKNVEDVSITIGVCNAAKDKKEKIIFDHGYKCGFCGLRIRNEELFVSHIQEHHCEKKKKTTIAQSDDKISSIGHNITEGSTTDNIYTINLVTSQISNNTADKLLMEVTQPTCRSSDSAISTVSTTNSSNFQDSSTKAELSDQSGDQSFLCTICNRTFNTPTNLVIHKQEHYPYTCIHCDFRARTSGALEEHGIALHSRIIRRDSRNNETDSRIIRRVFHCSQCKFSSLQEQEFRTHVNTHFTGKKLAFGCEHCDFVSATKDGLVRHLDTHFADTQALDFGCGHCDHIFTTKTGLARHILTHLEDRPKPFECPDCSYSTDRQSSLKRHVHTHLTEKLFQCSECDYKGAGKHYLTRHISNMHSDKQQKKFKCTECDFTAAKKRDLSWHIKSMHAKERSKFYLKTNKVSRQYY